MESASPAGSAPGGGNIPPRLSIVIPVLDEAHGIEAALDALHPYRARGHEIIVSDGGSTDDTLRRVVRAGGAAVRIVSGARGRARQMNAGAELATGEVLLFLHADTRLPADADRRIGAALSPGDAGKQYEWGGFDVRLSGAHPAFRLIERLISLRSRLSGILTGDQALFVRRARFIDMGGFAEVPLMEDVEFCRRLGRAGLAPARAPGAVVTSSRRWETDGIMRTIARMWWLRGAYALGVAPERLARHYRFGKSAGEQRA